MKRFIFCITTIFFVVSSFAQNLGEVTNATDFKKLQQELLLLKDLMSQDTVLHTEAIPLELDIRRQVDNIYLDMNTRLPHMDGRLTPEWKEFTEQLAEALEPHEEIILETAYRPLVDKNRKKTQLNRLTFNADQLIAFLKPDRGVELLMREKLVQYPELRWQIYRHLHELRLLRGTDIKDMEALGSEISDSNEKIKWAEEVSFYGSDAGLATLEKILLIPFDPRGSVNERGGPENNESFSSYIPVARAIKSLGKKGRNLLPIVKDRKDQIFSEYEKIFGIEFATNATRMFMEMEIFLNGKPCIYASARNRSGLLYPPGQDVKNNFNSAKTKTFDDESPLRPQKNRNTQSADDLEAVDHSQWQNGLIVLFGIMFVIIFATIKKFKSRLSKFK